MPALGSHCTLDLYGCPIEVLDDKERVMAAIRAAATRSRSTLLNEVAHRFEPHGVTALGLLAESHISVHTWPELGYAACDVFTCGEDARPELACKILIEALAAERYTQRRTPRGEAAPSPGARARSPEVDSASDGSSTPEVA